MKKYLVKIGLVALFAATLMSAEAQRSGRRRGAPATTNPQTGNAPNQGKPQQQTNETKTPSGYNPYGGIPIIPPKDKGGYNDSVVSKSLRSVDGTNNSFQGDRIPLAYEDLRNDDALLKETIWREIDIREKMNQPFRYDAVDDNGSQRFIDILLRSIKKDSVTAFADDGFRQPMTIAEVAQLTTGEGADTIPVYDPNDINKIDHYSVVPKTFDPTSITKFRIREQYIFDREASRLFIRIIGIAPVKTTFLEGSKTERTTVLFWVYYPDIRNSLAKAQVYNPKNMGYGRMTWEDLFENHMFSSYVTKTQFDNPSNKTIKQLIGKNDPLLALLEGENAKERIFNFEQDLWSY